MIVCIGGAVLDRKYRAKRPVVLHTSNPVDGFRSYGGVARNVAENLARLGATVRFASIVGNDDSGRGLVQHLANAGADVSCISTSSERPTAEYAAILSPENELVLGIADMQALDLLTPQVIEPALSGLSATDWVFFDCNLPAETIAWLIERRRVAGFSLALDTVSTPKAARLPKSLHGIDLLFTNSDEALALLRLDTGTPHDLAARLRLAGAVAAIVTNGAAGLVVAHGEQVEEIEAVPALPIDITGAGDALIAGTLHGLMSGERLTQAAMTGALLAALTTESAASVRPDLTAVFLSAARHRMPNIKQETS